MSECDRALLAKARKLIRDVYLYVGELLTELPEEAIVMREVAEAVVRFLRNPGNTYLAYYPATPVYIIVVILAQVVTYGPRELRMRHAPKVTFIVLYESCKRLTDDELRYVLAHEVTHAAVEEDEALADMLASLLAARYPERFAAPMTVDESGLRVLNAERLGALYRERPRESMRMLLRCSVRLRPIRA
jgi:hypothetical protein